MTQVFGYLNFILFIITICSVHPLAQTVTCEDGYYESSGTCLPGDSSCATGENGTEGLTGDEMIFNSTTKLCERCPDGQYFDTPRETCQDCGSSGLDKGAYQSHGFQCSGSESFNLATMKGVTTGNSNQTTIQNTQLQNLKYGRGTSFYVDPESTEIVELGTKKYPFKSISLVFLEILLVWSNTESDLIIYVKENTSIDIQQTYNYVINVSSLTIEPYSSTSSSPAQATLFVRQYVVEKLSPKTVFNLVSDTTLNITTATTSIAAREKALLSSTDTTIFIYKSNFTLKNLRLQGDLEADSQSGSYFLRPIYLQEKSVTIQDVDIQLTGMILRSLDPMSMQLENVYVDFHAMMGGFHMNIEGNYPEAYLDGLIQSKNLTAENASTRIAAFRIPFIVTSGPEDTYFEDSSLYVWGSLSEDRAIVEIVINTDGLPSDSRTHNFTYVRTKMSMSDNPGEDKFTTYYLDFNRDNTREVSGSKILS